MIVKDFRKLSLGKKASFLLLIISFILVPIFVYVSQKQTNIKPSKAATIIDGFGKALKFSNNQYNHGANGIIISDFNNISTDLTLEGWFKITGTSTKQYLFHVNASGYGDIDVYVEYGTLKAKNSLSFSAPIISGGYIRTNQWYNIAFVTNNYNCYLFLNGKKTAQSSAGACRNAFSQLPVDQPIIIGAYPGTWIGSPTLKYGFTGEMDDVRIKNGALYTQDFSVLQQPFDDDTNYKVLFHFDTENGTVVANAGLENPFGIIGGPTGSFSYVNSTVPTPTLTPPTPTPTLTPTNTPTPTSTPTRTPTPTKRPPGYIGPPVKINNDY